MKLSREDRDNLKRLRALKSKFDKARAKRFWAVREYLQPHFCDELFPDTSPKPKYPDESLASADCPACDYYADIGERCPVCLGMGRINLHDSDL